MPVRSPNKPRTIARWFFLNCKEWVNLVGSRLEKYGMEYNKDKVLFPNDLIQIAKWEGIGYNFPNNLPKKFKSTLVRKYSIPIIIVNGKSPKHAWWFMFGHELGHHFQEIIAPVSKKYLGKEAIELQADIFAYHCSMPDHKTERFIQMHDRNKDDVVNEIIKFSNNNFRKLGLESIPYRTEEHITLFSRFMYEWYIFRDKADKQEFYDFPYQAHFRRRISEISYEMETKL